MFASRSLQISSKTRTLATAANLEVLSNLYKYLHLVNHLVTRCFFIIRFPPFSRGVRGDRNVMECHSILYVRGSLRREGVRLICIQSKEYIINNFTYLQVSCYAFNLDKTSEQDACPSDRLTRTLRVNVNALQYFHGFAVYNLAAHQLSINIRIGHKDHKKTLEAPIEKSGFYKICERITDTCSKNPTSDH